MTSSRRAQRGFTLMELLVTLSVTTIGLIGLLGLHLSLARGNNDSARSAEAQTVATQTLEGLRSQLIPDMMTTLTGTSTSTPPVTNTTLGTVTGRSGMTYRRVVKVTAPTTSANLWLVRVEVSWTEDGATVGSNGGQLDHTIAVEVLRTVQEAL